MEGAEAGLEQQVARRMKQLRAGRGLSLEALARRSGVSRSMISLIERAESSPTANVLYKLAASLGVTLASLFAEGERAGASPVSPRAEQRAWRDPASGYLRRNLSPPGFPSALELVEVILPPGAHVAYERMPRGPVFDQQVWLLEGNIEVTTAGKTHRLSSGDCLAMQVDGPISFRNRTRKPSRHLVALALHAGRGHASRTRKKGAK